MRGFSKGLPKNVKSTESAVPPYDEGGGFCETKDGGREKLKQYIKATIVSRFHKYRHNSFFTSASIVAGKLWVESGVLSQFVEITNNYHRQGEALWH